MFAFKLALSSLMMCLIDENMRSDSNDIANIEKIFMIIRVSIDSRSLCSLSLGDDVDLAINKRLVKKLLQLIYRRHRLRCIHPSQKF